LAAILVVSLEYDPDEPVRAFAVEQVSEAKVILVKEKIEKIKLRGKSKSCCSFDKVFLGIFSFNNRFISTFMYLVIYFIYLV